MAGAPGEEYAALVNTLMKWAFDPKGYERYARKEKIEQLTGVLKVCLDNRDFAGVDLVFAELRRVSATTD